MTDTPASRPSAPPSDPTRACPVCTFPLNKHSVPCIPGRSGDGDPPPPLTPLLDAFAADPSFANRLALVQFIAAVESALASQRAARARAEQERETLLGLVVEARERAGAIDGRGDALKLLNRAIALLRASGQPEAVSRDA